VGKKKHANLTLTSWTFSLSGKETRPLVGRGRNENENGTGGKESQAGDFLSKKQADYEALILYSSKLANFVAE